MRIKLKSAFKLLILTSTVSVFFAGCSYNSYKEKKSTASNANLVVGSWYATGIKKRKSNLLINQSKKEVFYKNGLLLSSKWFNFKDAQGRDLGEYYITKSFKWHTKGSRIIVKFNRCSVGITRTLSASNLGYYKLKRVCQNSMRRRGKISAKQFKIVDYNTMLLGGVLYHKE